MDRRTLIAVGLSVVVIVGSLLVQTFLFPTPDGALGFGAVTDPGSQTAADDRTTADEAYRDVFAPLASSVAAEGSDPAAGQRLIVKETDLFALAFTTAGGDLTSIRLKQHHDVDGTEVELVLRPEQHRFFTVSFGGFRTEPVDAVFSFQEVDQYTWRFTRRFVAEDGVPFTLTKTYTFPPRSYLFELEIQIENSANELPALDSHGTSYTLGIGPQIGPAYESLDGRNEFRNFRNYVDGKANNQRMRREPVLAEAKRVTWTAIAGKYFAIIAVPDATLYTITYDKRKDPELSERSALFFSRPLITSSKNVDTFRFYAGPLKREILNRYNNAASDPFGIGNYQFQEAARTNPIIGWLANILRFFLDFFYRLVPNYGVAIILLTVLIKILFFPLTHKSFESTSKMSMLAPKIEELKKKYQGKPEKLNQEMMALYRKEGVNPVGGCLPLLLQMPIFFALFELLNNAFDLRGAAFIAPWIGDLSAPESFLPFGFTIPLLNWDELRILPFVMLGTTLLQSRISQNPGAMQPQMKMMMYAMPIFFFFILYSMPSGLVIYWTMQNVLSIAQQLYINDRRRRAGPDGGTAPAGARSAREVQVTDEALDRKIRGGVAMAEREYEGRTEEEAIDKAIEALGLTEDEIDVEVVDEQRPGFLKGGKVRIRVHLADDEPDPPELEPENGFEERIVDFVTELLEKANLAADVRIDHREEGRLTLEILSDDPAIVIGKHGATLEALQLVTNIHAGRINDGDPVRVILDTEDYRYRREQSLLRMANRVAHEVRRTGRPRLLAPLNPFERRLIHTALGEMGGVTTESEGHGLYKQIRVSSVD